VFPPTPRSYDLKLPKKMRRQATRSALSSRIADNAVVVVDSLQPAEPRTKEMVSALQNLDVSGKVMLIDERISEDTGRAARNIPRVDMKPSSTINIVDVLNHDYLVFSVGAVRQLERLLSDGDV
jgi:large subunit ribosomal protein L4